MMYLWPTAGLRRRGRSGNVYRRDYDSEAALRGIPLESGYGNITYVEGGSGRVKHGMSKSNRKDMQSADTIVGAGEKWDISIVKTTDIVTVLDDDVHTVSRKSYDSESAGLTIVQMARPQGVLIR
jgi:hypothetical protein